MTLPWIRKCKETQSFVEYWFAEPQRTELSRLARRLGLSRLIPGWALNALRVALSKIIVTKQAGASLVWDVSDSRPHRKRLSNEFDTTNGFIYQAERLAELLEET